jgi:hypothetical protein
MKEAAKPRGRRRGECPEDLLGGDAVGAFAIGPFEGLDGEPHLLAEAAGDEAADAVAFMPMSA